MEGSGGGGGGESAPATPARRRGRPPGSLNKPREQAPAPAAMPTDRPSADMDDDKLTIRGKNWRTPELQELINAWSHCLMHKAGMDEKSAQFHQRVFERFAANCTGECGSTDGVCRRTVKSVGDKIASIRLMYRFINDFNTHDRIPGSEDLPHWYDLDKRQRKDFCRRHDRQQFHQVVYEQLSSLFESDQSAEHQGPVSYKRPLPAPAQVPEGAAVVGRPTAGLAPLPKRPTVELPPQAPSIEMQHLAGVVQQQSQSILRMVQEWRESESADRERQRKADAEERSKDREMMLAALRMMMDTVRPPSTPQASTRP